MDSFGGKLRTGEDLIADEPGIGNDRPRIGRVENPFLQPAQLTVFRIQPAGGTLPNRFEPARSSFSHAEWTPSPARNTSQARDSLGSDGYHILFGPLQTTPQIPPASFPQDG